MERGLILGRLLDKYEKSKHLLQPDVSKRRIMLRIDKDELPEYRLEIADVRDRFNAAARALEQEGLLQVEWLQARPVISCIILNLTQIDKAYDAAQKPHPANVAREICSIVESALSGVHTSWIKDWRDNTCEEIRRKYRIPANFKQNIDNAQAFVHVLSCYDRLDGLAVTTRAFSTICFQNSKRFEKDFQADFLRAAMRFCPELTEYAEPDDLGDREKLEILGIYAHPELYPLSGRCQIVTKSGTIDLSPVFPQGLAIPGSAIDKIIAFRLADVQRILFIENMTNYDEYLRREIAPYELVLYHGGFLSPKKRQMVQKIAESLRPETEVYLWADIDLGGFRMFAHLQALFSRLKPMRMSAEDAARFVAVGLSRDTRYMKRLQAALDQGEFPLFEDAIRILLDNDVTIEQEVFFTSFE